jgi:hypothetical protein
MYLVPTLPAGSSDTPHCCGTVLHTRMYLAVSAGLNRIVSVRNTVVTHDGRYPLRLLAKSCVFGLSSSPTNFMHYNNPILFLS